MEKTGGRTVETVFEKLPAALLPWYEKNKRDLPWRGDKEPYRVWLSEIMLQQTRVEAVKGYYSRFLAALPNVESLANCDDDALHKLWEGLGYYSRVRNLKKCAQTVIDQFGGRFPEEYEKVLKLPGIGEYTAGAVCSICFDRPTPAVDGNVLRVVSRLTRDETPIDSPAYKTYVRRELEKVYPAQAGDFTQALMELGATVCGPNRKPDCYSCPCKDFCESAKMGDTDRFPVKLPKKAKREEDKTVFILSCDGKYALEKRAAKGLLAGLWQFPNCAGKLETADALQWVRRWDIHPRELQRQVERNHIFTHIRWNMRGIYMEVAECAGDFVWMTAEQVEKDAALPTAFRQFWEEIKDV